MWRRIPENLWWHVEWLLSRWFPPQLGKVTVDGWYYARQELCAAFVN